MTELGIIATIITTASGGLSSWALARAALAGLAAPAPDPAILQSSFDEAFGDVARGPIPSEMAELLDRLN